MAGEQHQVSEGNVTSGYSRRANRRFVIIRGRNAWLIPGVSWLPESKGYFVADFISGLALNELFYEEVVEDHRRALSSFSPDALITAAQFAKMQVSAPGRFKELAEVVNYLELTLSKMNFNLSARWLQFTLILPSLS